LDQTYQLVDVFDERSVVRVIISDDGSSLVRRFSSSFPHLVRAQSQEAGRRDSFDSAAGYATPSLSSLNTSSPISHHRLNGQSLDEARKSLNVTEIHNIQNRGSEEQPRLLGRSPEIAPEPVPKVTPASTRQPKRKRQNRTEIPASPENGSPPEKKRSIEMASTQPVTLSETQESLPQPEELKIPETPVQSRKRKASTVKPRTPPKEKNARKTSANATQEETAMQVDTFNPRPKESEPEKQVVTLSTPQGTRPPRQRSQKMERESKVALENEPPKVEEQSKFEEPAKPVEPPLKAPAKPRGRKAAPKSPTTQSRSADSLQLVEPGVANPAKRQTAGGKSKAAPVITSPTSPTIQLSDTSATSQSKSLDVPSDDEDIATSDTSSSASSDSESDSGSESEKSDSGSDSDEESSGEKMSVEETRSSSESVGTSSLGSSSPKAKSVSPAGSPVRKTASVDVTKPSVHRSLSRSASVASKSTSSSDSGSGSDSDSDSESSASDSSASGSKSGSEDKESGSESESSQSDSDSDSHSDSNASNYSKASKISISKPASESSAASSNSSGKENFSSSSNIVAASLGGHTIEKPRSVIKQLPASQITDRTSPRSTNLSQQSATMVVGRGGSKLGNWTGLSQISQRMEAMAKAPQPTKKVREESEESESQSDSTDDSSDESDHHGNGVPKAKLAGRAPATKKKSSGGLRAMFK